MLSGDYETRRNAIEALLNDVIIKAILKTLSRIYRDHDSKKVREGIVEITNRLFPESRYIFDYLQATKKTATPEAIEVLPHVAYVRASELYRLLDFYRQSEKTPAGLIELLGPPLVDGDVLFPS